MEAEQPIRIQRRTVNFPSPSRCLASPPGLALSGQCLDRAASCHSTNSVGRVPATYNRSSNRLGRALGRSHRRNRQFPRIVGAGDAARHDHHEAPGTLPEASGGCHGSPGARHEALSGDHSDLFCTDLRCSGRAELLLGPLLRTWGTASLPPGRASLLASRPEGGFHYASVPPDIAWSWRRHPIKRPVLLFINRPK